MNGSPFLTVVTGVTVFVVGQIILKWFMDPILGFKEQLGRVSALFLREQSAITNAKYSDELVRELKETAATLLAKKTAIPWYSLWSKLKLLPSGEKVYAASQAMNMISHMIIDAHKVRGASHSVFEEKSSQVHCYNIMKYTNIIAKELNIVTTFSAR